jgi:stearoyl-CoA desaturase (Delta-9 desaturase)
MTMDAVDLDSAKADAKARKASAGAPAPGIRVGGIEAASRNKEHLFYAATKNGGTLLAIVWLITQPTGWIEWSAFGVFYVMNILSMSLGYHRYFTHRAFETSTPMRYGLAILAQLGIYGSLLRWCADHRRHHALADQPGDVHSPYVNGKGEELAGWKGFKHSHLGWAFDEVTSDYAIYGKGLVDDPAVMFAHRTRFVWYGVSVILLPWMWAQAWGGGWHSIVGTILVGGFLRANVALHAIAAVNSIGHMMGYKRFDVGDEARNNWVLGILTLGEGWHNNHHAHPRVLTTQFAWYEIDMTGWLILGMEKLGLVWNVKRAPALTGAEPHHAT